MPVSTSNEQDEAPASKHKQRCKTCKEFVMSDGYGELVHVDGFYMCEGKEGEVAK